MAGAPAHVYSAYGLRLVCDRPIPALVGARPPDGDLPVVAVTSGPLGRDLRGAMAGPPVYTSRHADAEGRPLLRAWTVAGREWVLCYADGISFVIDYPGTNVDIQWPEGPVFEDTLPYLLGPVLGFVLRLRGVVSLHASAVVIDGRAVLFLGSGGAGKSTTAAAFAHRGVPVLSDDVIALTETTRGFDAQPGYPQVCLWPDAMATVFGDAAQLPRVAPRTGVSADWDKRYFHLSDRSGGFADRAVPVGALYLLGSEAQGRHTPEIRPLDPRTSAVSLLANTYVSYLTDPVMQARDFATLVRLAQQVGVRTLSRGLPRAMCDAVQSDLHANHSA